jgi:hypothetical protein
VPVSQQRLLRCRTEVLITPRGDPAGQVRGIGRPIAAR